MAVAFYDLRIADLAEGRSVFVECLACRHVAYVETAVIKARFAPDERVKTMHHRFRCSRCGKRGDIRVDTKLAVEAPAAGR